MGARAALVLHRRARPGRRPPRRQPRQRPAASAAGEGAKGRQDQLGLGRDGSRAGAAGRVPAPCKCTTGWACPASTVRPRCGKRQAASGPSVHGSSTRARPSAAGGSPACRSGCRAPAPRRARRGARASRPAPPAPAVGASRACRKSPSSTSRPAPVVRSASLRRSSVFGGFSGTGRPRAEHRGLAQMQVGDEQHAGVGPPGGAMRQQMQDRARHRRNATAPGSRAGGAGRRRRSGERIHEAGRRRARAAGRAWDDAAPAPAPAAGQFSSTPASARACRTARVRRVRRQRRRPGLQLGHHARDAFDQRLVGKPFSRKRSTISGSCGDGRLSGTRASGPSAMRRSAAASWSMASSSRSSSARALCSSAWSGSPGEHLVVERGRSMPAAGGCCAARPVALEDQAGDARDLRGSAAAPVRRRSGCPSLRPAARRTPPAGAASSRGSSRHSRIARADSKFQPVVVHRQRERARRQRAARQGQQRGQAQMDRTARANGCRTGANPRASGFRPPAGPASAGAIMAPLQGQAAGLGCRCARRTLPARAARRPGAGQASDHRLSGRRRGWPARAALGGHSLRTASGPAFGRGEQEHMPPGRGARDEAFFHCARSRATDELHLHRGVADDGADVAGGGVPAARRPCARRLRRQAGAAKSG